MGAGGGGGGNGLAGVGQANPWLGPALQIGGSALQAATGQPQTQQPYNFNSPPRRNIFALTDPNLQVQGGRMPSVPAAPAPMNPITLPGGMPTGNGPQVYDPRISPMFFGGAS